MINSISQNVPLNDKGEIPGYGFGMYKAEGQQLLGAIADAFSAGYRLFDTAAFYGNEETVGQGIAGLPRQEIFLISKIWPTHFDRPVKSLDDTLLALKQDYLDACLLHWPGTDQKAMLHAFEALLGEREKGRIRHLGVSNFLPEHLRLVHSRFQLWPSINQIELHPWFQQPALCAFCKEQAIAVMVWSPLGRGTEFADATIGAIAQECGKTPAQVILRWHTQKNHIPIPKSVHASRIRQNADIFDFTLNGAQMAKLDGLDKGARGRRGADPLTFNG